MNNHNLILKITFTLLLFSILNPVIGQKKIKVKEKDSKFGFYKGKKLVSDNVYDEIKKSWDINYVRIGDKWGTVSEVGKEVIPISYDSIFTTKHESYIVRQNDKFGVIDSENRVQVPIQFEKLDHYIGNGEALVKDGGIWGVYNNGKFDTQVDTMIFSRPEKEALYSMCQGDFENFEELAACSKFEMLNIIYRKLRYPADARERGIGGMVVISFLISPEGIACCFKIEKSDYPSLGAEAFRIVKTLKNWTPAENEGQKVWMKYIMPVKFRLH